MLLLEFVISDASLWIDVTMLLVKGFSKLIQPSSLDWGFVSYFVCVTQDELDVYAALPMWEKQKIYDGLLGQSCGF